MSLLAEAQPPAMWSIGPPRLFAGTDGGHHVTWAEHEALHGPRARLSRAALVAAVTSVGLLGRGGAAFPVARKLASLPRRVHAVVVNGSESEPLSHKDRTLLRKAPHLVLDGALVVAEAARARLVVISVHDRVALESVTRAVSERPDAGRVYLDHRPGHRFVSGEARAVLRAASGGPAVPPGRRTLPSDAGLDNRPTFLSNVETFAQLGLLARHGPARYAERGCVDEPGTSLLTLSGTVARPGVVEIPNGIPSGVLADVAGVDPDAALLVGGYHGLWMPARSSLAISRPALAERGLTLGAGVIAAISADTCPLGEVAHVARWLAAQSAGQCGPCVFGLPAITRDLDRLVDGDRAGLTDVRRHLGLVKGRGACAHPDGVSRLTASTLDRFPEDVQMHLDRGSCGRPVQRQLGVDASRNRPTHASSARPS